MIQNVLFILVFIAGVMATASEDGVPSSANDNGVQECASRLSQEYGDFGTRWYRNDESAGEDFLLWRARDFVLGSYASFSGHRLEMPTQTTFIIVGPGERLPTVVPYGMDLDFTGKFWLHLDPKALGTSLIEAGVEVGKYVFDYNLQRFHPEYAKWLVHRKNWLGDQSNVGRMRLAGDLRVKGFAERSDYDAEVFAHPSAAIVNSNPWAQIVRDYEVAFGLLWAAALVPQVREWQVAEDQHPLVANEVLWRRPLVQTLMDKMDSFQSLLPSFVWEPPPAQYDPYQNFFRPSLRRIYMDLIRERNPRQRAVALERIFFAFSKLIEESRSMYLDRNRRLLDMLPSLKGVVDEN